MNSKWIIDLKKNFFELIRREKSLIIIYPFFHFNPSLELFKKYFNVSKFILFRDLSKFPMNLMGEFIRKYIRKEILNLIEKEIEFYKDTFSNKFFKYIILKKNESFKNILTKNKIQKQIFKKIFGLKDLQISRIQNNNPIFMNNFSQIISKQKKLNKVKKKKFRKIRRRVNTESLNVWLKCLKFFLAG